MGASSKPQGPSQPSRSALTGNFKLGLLRLRPRLGFVRASRGEVGIVRMRLRVLRFRGL